VKKAILFMLGFIFVFCSQLTIPAAGPSYKVNGNINIFMAIENANLDGVKNIVTKEGFKINFMTKLKLNGKSLKITPLHYAIYVLKISGLFEKKQENSVNIINYLIDQKSDVNAKDSRGDRPLHYAARQGEQEVAKLLVQKGANIDARNIKLQTPRGILQKAGKKELLKDLRIISAVNAVKKGDLKKFKKYSRGLDVNEVKYKGKTFLHYAAEKKKFDIAKYLLDERGAKVVTVDIKNVDINNLFNRYKDLWNIVKAVIESNSLGKVKEIFDRYPRIVKDINSMRDESGSTFLHMAAEKGNLAIIKFLIKKGAKASLRNFKGDHPHDMAKSEKIKKYLKSEFLKERKKTKKLRENLKFAIKYSDLNKVKKLLGKKDLKNYDLSDEKSGYPLLFQAIESDKSDIVKYLVDEKKVFLQWKVPGGFTPLHRAVFKNKLDIVKYLVQKGANKEAKDDRGWTPLHTAVKKDFLPIVTYLVENGANIEAKDESKRTPLHIAVKYESSDSFEFLVEKGANKEAKDKSGKTPLDLVERLNPTNIEKYLKKQKKKPKRPKSRPKKRPRNG